MTTKNFVPRADSEGSLGTTLKRWASAFVDAITGTHAAFTVADTGNVVGLTVTQNDATNNPHAVAVMNVGSGLGISLVQNGSGVAQYVQQNANKGGLQVDGTAAFTAPDGIGFMFVRLEHASSTGDLLHLQNNGAGRGFCLDQNGNATAVSIQSDATTAHVLRVDADSATSANLLRVASNSASQSGGIALFVQDNASATGRVISAQSDGSGDALYAVQNHNSGIVGNFVMNGSSNNAVQIICGSSHNSSGLYMQNSNGSYTGHMLNITNTIVGGSGWHFGTFRSAGSADEEFRFRGDGQGYADGSWNGSGADYAEWLESLNGTKLPFGICVVFDSGKIRPCAKGDAPESIIGVTRPQPGDRVAFGPVVIGNSAWPRWTGKYLLDDWGCYVLEPYTHYSWMDEDGNEFSYAYLPQGVVPPDDAEAMTHDAEGARLMRRKLNPAYDPTLEYVAREERPEWNLVGFLGQILVAKGQPIPERWIHIREHSPVNDWYLVR